MPDESMLGEAVDAADEGPVLTRRRVEDTADLDITPMIDITFLLLIFFLVCSTSDVQNSVELPPARHGKGVSERTSIIVTIAERGGPGSAVVYWGDGTSGERLPDDPAAQEEEVGRRVREEFDQGKSAVLVKAAKGVLHREVARVAAAAGQIEGIQLHLAVFEVE